jgi:hypothetical protein
VERIGSRYYTYDGNGNLLLEREGSHGQVTALTSETRQDGELYGTNYGFALENGGDLESGAYERRYDWNERNLMVSSRDAANSVQYRYGADGERTIKHNDRTGKETLYFIPRHS